MCAAYRSRGERWCPVSCHLMVNSCLFGGEALAGSEESQDWSSSFASGKSVVNTKTTKTNFDRAVKAPGTLGGEKNICQILLCFLNV